MSNIEKIIKTIKEKNKKRMYDIPNGETIYYIDENDNVCKGTLSNWYGCAHIPGVEGPVVQTANDELMPIQPEDIYLYENDAKTVVNTKFYNQLQTYKAEITDQNSLIKFMFAHGFQEHHNDMAAQLAIQLKAKEFGINLV